MICAVGKMTVVRAKIEVMWKSMRVEDRLKKEFWLNLLFNRKSKEENCKINANISKR